MRELGNFLNMSTGSAESVKDFPQVSSILHRDNSELILFVYPDEECLFFVMENASTIRPVSVKTYCLKESISLLKEEVIFNKLLSLGLSHTVKGIVSTS